MRLAVVIPSGPRLDRLARCLHSVHAAKPPNCEVIVVADSPADSESVANRFPGVRVIRVPRQGFAASANAGIHAASAEVVELLNDDTEVEPNWASALAAFADPRVGSVAPLVLKLDSRHKPRPVIDSASDEYDPGGFARKHAGGTTWTGTGPLATPGNAWGANATAGFYRRAALEAVGGFPGDFGSYFEDVDLAHRLNRAGWICRYEPGSIVWHAAHGSYGARPCRRTLTMQSRNEERVFWRNTPPRELMRWLPRHIAVLAGKALRRVDEGELRPWLAGRVVAWVGLVDSRGRSGAGSWGSERPQELSTLTNLGE